MPKIEVTDPANVLVDGVNVGSVADVFANYPRDKHPAIPGAVQKALGEHIAGRDRKHDDNLKAVSDAHAAAVESHRAELAKLRGEVTEKHKAEVATISAAQAEHRRATKEQHRLECDSMRQTITRLEATVREQAALIEAAGGTEAVQRLRLEQRRAAAEAELAAVAAHPMMAERRSMSGA